MTILSYTTTSQVTDHCAINLDQAALEEALALKDDAAFEAAKKIYKMGGKSKSYATVTLSTPLAANIPQYEPITGLSTSGKAVEGKAYADTATTVMFVSLAKFQTFCEPKSGGAS